MGTQSSKNGRRVITLQVGSTELETTSLRITTRLKSRDKLLRALLFLEYWESLKENLKFLKYYFPEFYTSKEFILIEDLILQTRDIPKTKYNKRLQFLWDYGILKHPVTKQELVTQIAGLEYKIQVSPTRGHNTRYGYVKHYRDHGHLPPEKPDYSKSPEELEEAYLQILQEEELYRKTRLFLLNGGKTNFEDMFPGFQKVIFRHYE